MKPACIALALGASLLTFLLTRLTHTCPAPEPQTVAAQGASGPAGFEEAMLEEPLDSFREYVQDILHITPEDSTWYVDNLVVFHPESTFIISQGDTIARFSVREDYMYRDGYFYELKDDIGPLYLGRVDSEDPVDMYQFFLYGRNFD
jgi:hypothetical protein